MRKGSRNEGKLDDVQASKAPQMIPLAHVGVVDLEYPVCIRHNGVDRNVIMNITMDIDLPERQRGAHMSRFVERLEEEFKIPSLVHSIEELAEVLAKDQLKIHTYATHSQVELSTRIDYVDGKVYDLYASYNTSEHVKWIGVRTVGAIACPCAIQLTGGLSHNQRASLKVMLGGEREVEAEEIVAICEDSFSAPVKLKLKRPMERDMVLRMHANPRFVEDVVRRCVTLLCKRFRGMRASVECVSHESIHPYDVFAKWEGKL
jgi:GTP cyclohydrolase FolE2